MKKERKAKAPLGEIFTRDFLIIATINLAMFFGFQMTNVGIPVYMAQLGAPAHIVGLAATLMTITATIMRVFAGAFLDRVGRMGMLVGGTVIMLCSIISYAVFPVVGIILGMRLIQGIGWGAGSTASSTIAADIIPKHRFAEGMGYFAMTNAISSALAPAISVELAQGSGGAAMVYVASAIVGISFLLAVAEVLLSRRKGEKPPSGGAEAPVPVQMAATHRPAPAQYEKPTPGGAGATSSAQYEKPTPSGADAPAPAQVTAEMSPVTAQAELAHPPAPAQAELAHPQASAQAEATHRPAPAQAAAAHRPAPNAPASKLDVIFERRAFVPSVLIMLVNIGFGCITTFIALHALDQGVGSVSPYFVVYAVVTLVSRPYIGKLIDRYGYRMPAILSTLCTAGTLVLIGASNSVVMFASAGVLGGLGLGTAMSTYQAMAVANVEPWRRGVATSTYMTAFDLGIAIGSFFGGFIAAAFGYAPMYYTSALFPLAACALSLFAVKNTAQSA